MSVASRVGAAMSANATSYQWLQIDCRAVLSHISRNVGFNYVGPYFVLCELRGRLAFLATAEVSLVGNCRFEEKMNLLEIQ